MARTTTASVPALLSPRSPQATMQPQASMRPGRSSQPPLARSGSEGGGLDVFGKGSTSAEAQAPCCIAWLGHAAAQAGPAMSCVSRPSSTAAGMAQVPLAPQAPRPSAPSPRPPPRPLSERLRSPSPSASAPLSSVSVAATSTVQQQQLLPPPPQQPLRPSSTCTCISSSCPGRAGASVALGPSGSGASACRSRSTGARPMAGGLVRAASSASTAASSSHWQPSSPREPQAPRHPVVGDAGAVLQVPPRPPGPSSALSGQEARLLPRPAPSESAWVSGAELRNSSWDLGTEAAAGVVDELRSSAAATRERMARLEEELAEAARRQQELSRSFLLCTRENGGTVARALETAEEARAASAGLTQQVTETSNSWSRLQEELQARLADLDDLLRRTRDSSDERLGQLEAHIRDQGASAMQVQELRSSLEARVSDLEASQGSTIEEHAARLSWRTAEFEKTQRRALEDTALDIEHRWSSSIGRLEERMLAFEKRFSTSTGQLQERASAIEQRFGVSIELLQERVLQLQQRCDRIDATSPSAIGQIEERLDKRLVQLERTCDGLNSQSKAHSAQVGSCSHRVELMQNDVSQLTLHYDALVDNTAAEVGSCSHKSELLQNEISQLTLRYDALVDNTAAEVSACSQRLDAQREELGGMRSSAEDGKRALAEASKCAQRLEALHTEVQGLSGHIQEAFAQASTCTPRLDVFQADLKQLRCCFDESAKAPAFKQVLAVLQDQLGQLQCRCDSVGTLVEGTASKQSLDLLQQKVDQLQGMCSGVDRTIQAALAGLDVDSVKKQVVDVQCRCDGFEKMHHEAAPQRKTSELLQERILQLQRQVDALGASVEEQRKSAASDMQWRAKQVLSDVPPQTQTTPPPAVPGRTLPGALLTVGSCAIGKDLSVSPAPPLPPLLAEHIVSALAAEAPGSPIKPPGVVTIRIAALAAAAAGHGRFATRVRAIGVLLHMRALF
mmetsp:Transcript_74864/g.243159  ORF Transcript_74864/g.243159 Transcript_74864/m.243159 type:complete len:962 (+) Transcript_74864:66-2951(+)